MLLKDGIKRLIIWEHRGGKHKKFSNLLIFKGFSVFSVVNFWHYQKWKKDKKMNHREHGEKLIISLRLII